MTELLTVRDVAMLCHLHEVTVRRHIAAGRLPSVRVGGGVRVRREDLETFITPRVSPDDDSARFGPDDPLFGLVGLVNDEPYVSAEKHAILAEAQLHSR